MDALLATPRLRQVTVKAFLADVHVQPLTLLSLSLATGFNLPSKYILHTVGPVYSSSRKSECEAQLESCYKTTLNLAIANNLRTIALCGVSTGIYGFPLGPATEIALKTVRNVLEEQSDKLDRVIFCNFGSKDVEVYEELVVSILSDLHSGCGNSYRFNLQSKYFPPAK